MFMRNGIALLPGLCTASVACTTCMYVKRWNILSVSDVRGREKVERTSLNVVKHCSISQTSRECSKCTLLVAKSSEPNCTIDLSPV